jgi:hypothetical protein
MSTPTTITVTRTHTLTLDLEAVASVESELAADLLDLAVQMAVKDRDIHRRLLEAVVAVSDARQQQVRRARHSALRQACC